MLTRTLAGAVLIVGCNRASAPASDERRHADDFRDASADAALPEPDYSVADFCSDLRSAWLERCEQWQQGDCEPAADSTFGAEVCLATERAVRAGRVRYDPHRAARCVQKGAFDLASAWQSGWVAPLLCDGMFRGTSEIGEPCYPDETLQRVCREGWCQREDDCPGVCTSHAAAGEHCIPERCAPGYYCSADNRCLLELAVAQDCPDGWGCALPAICVEGSCRVLGDLGESCGEQSPCAYPLLCAEGACVAQVGAGDPCETDRHCPDGYACGFVPPGGFDRGCVERPRIGEACDRRSGCAPGARCASDGSPLLGTCESDPDPVEPEPSPEPAQPSRPPSCVGD